MNFPTENKKHITKSFRKINSIYYTRTQNLSNFYIQYIIHNKIISSVPPIYIYTHLRKAVKVQGHRQARRHRYWQPARSPSCWASNWAPREFEQQARGSSSSRLEEQTSLAYARLARYCCCHWDSSAEYGRRPPANAITRPIREHPRDRHFYSYCLFARGIYVLLNIEMFFFSVIRRKWIKKKKKNK